MNPFFSSKDPEEGVGLMCVTGEMGTAAFGGEVRTKKR